MVLITAESSEKTKRQGFASRRQKKIACELRVQQQYEINVANQLQGGCRDSTMNKRLVNTNNTAVSAGGDAICTLRTEITVAVYGGMQRLWRLNLSRPLHACWGCNGERLFEYLLLLKSVDALVSNNSVPP